MVLIPTSRLSLLSFFRGQYRARRGPLRRLNHVMFSVLRRRDYRTYFKVATALDQVSRR